MWRNIALFFKLLAKDFVETLSAPIGPIRREGETDEQFKERQRQYTMYPPFC